MKRFNIPSVTGKSGFSLLSLLIIGMLFTSCREEPKLWVVDSQQQLIGDFVSNNPDEFSEFDKLIKTTGLSSLLKTRGPFTLFLPDNEAMQAYYALKGVNSQEEFSEEQLDELVRYHIVGLGIPTNDITLGALPATNGVGDYLATEFLNADIIISKESKIVKRDIETANGFIHVLDKTIDPITKDVFNVVNSDPSYSIFSEGLIRTGLHDTLQLISFPYGDKLARTRFTLLPVTDTIFQRYGINNVNDLIAWCGGNPDSSTYLNDEFYRFMEYHCLAESYFLSDLINGIYPILSRDNNMSFRIDTDYKINYDSKTEEYTGFIIPASNTPAKNGAVHAVNDILPVTDPEPAPIRFETTDFFDLQQGDYFGKYYMRWFDGENTFANIKWKGDYMLYYFKENQNQTSDHDCLSMVGWFEMSITFPKVMKGKYEVMLYQPGWGDVTNCIIYIDGVKTPYVYEGPYGGTGGQGGLQKVADVDFKTTEEHTITIQNIVHGMLFWDYVIFQPVS